MKVLKWTDTGDIATVTINGNTTLAVVSGDEAVEQELELAYSTPFYGWMHNYTFGCGWPLVHDMPLSPSAVARAREELLLPMRLCPWVKQFSWRVLSLNITEEKTLFATLSFQTLGGERPRKVEVTI